MVRVDRFEKVEPIRVGMQRNLWMKSYGLVFAMALAISLASMPAVRRIAVKLGALAHPRDRDVHDRAIPRLGGLGIALALSLPLLTALAIDSGAATVFRRHLVQAIGLVVGGAAVCALGAVDDVRGVRAGTKLAVQVCVGALAYGLGFRIDGVSLPLLGVLPMGVFALPVTVLWIVGVTNAVNLIDGLDGLAGGIVFVAGVTNLVVAVLFGNVFVALVMASLLGAVLGFLFFNFYPARVFMGDSGSYFLGFVLATASLAGASHKASTAVSLLVPMLALGLPIFDTLLSMIRRSLERRPMFSPDRGHLHHKLLELGLTQRRAVLVLYLVSSMLAVVAVTVSLDRHWESGVALVVVGLTLFILVRSVGYFEVALQRRRQRQRLRDPRTERMRATLRSTLRAIRASSSQDELVDVLGSFGAALELTGIECVPVDGTANPSTGFRWPSRRSLHREHDLVKATFSLGRDHAATHRLRFIWASTEDISPQCDIMLQLIVDEAAERLVTLRSGLVPAQDVEAECPSTGHLQPAPLR